MRPHTCIQLRSRAARPSAGIAPPNAAVDAASVRSMNTDLSATSPPSYEPRRTSPFAPCPSSPLGLSSTCTAGGDERTRSLDLWSAAGETRTASCQAQLLRAAGRRPPFKPLPQGATRTSLRDQQLANEALRVARPLGSAAAAAAAALTTMAAAASMWHSGTAVTCSTAAAAASSSSSFAAAAPPAAPPSATAAALGFASAVAAARAAHWHC